MKWEPYWPALTALVLCVAAIAAAPTRYAPVVRQHSDIDWHHMQTCVFASAKKGEFGDKPGYLCDRLDIHTHWALRQRI